MASKKDINQLLKQMGYTWEQMQSFWDECIEINWKVKMLAQSGKNWNDLNLSCIKDLPNLKEITLNQKQEEEERKRQEMLQKEEDDAEEQYYIEHFEQIIAQKIQDGVSLTENDLQTLVNEYEEEREYGDKGRWTQSVVSIVKLCDKYYQICWEEALTEYQENSFLNQPIEVRKHTYEKTITVTEWLEVR